MSRIGRKPIVIPAGVTVTVDEAAHTVAVKGPKGSLNSNYHPLMTVKVEGNEVLVTRPNDEPEARSLHGLTRTNIANMVNGVVNGYEKKLEIVGVGLRCQKQGSNLVMNLGFSHQVNVPDTEDCTIVWQDPNHFSVTGIDKQKVGQYAAEIRAKKPPEPYKGKGIRYAGEVVKHKEGKAGKGKVLRASGNTLENRVYKVTLDANGDIASVIDKRNGRDLVEKGRAFRLAVLTPNVSNRYPAWEIHKATLDQTPEPVDTDVRISVAECGAARASLKVERRYGDSRLVQYIRLTDGGDDERIDIVADIDWKTPDALLKAEFPMSVSAEEAVYDIGIGNQRRPTNHQRAHETFAHHWADLSDGDYGIAVLNDSKYGWDKPADNTLRLSLLHTPSTEKRYADQRDLDFGRHTMTYSLVGHDGDHNRAGVVEKGELLNQPLLSFTTPKHPGKLGRRFSFVAASTPQIAVKALKKAEDGSGYIVRVFETTGREVRGAELAFPVRIVSAEEVNGIEEPVGEARFEGNRLIVDAGRFAPKTYKVTLAEAPVAAPAIENAFVDFPVNQNSISSDAFKSVAKVDKECNSYAAELMPEVIVHGGIEYRRGEPDVKNVLNCREAVTVDLPQGDYNKVYILASSSRGDRKAVFDVDGRKYEAVVPYYSGFRAQWAWADKTKSFVKDGTIAHIGNHRHKMNGRNDAYTFTYLYRLGFDIASGAGKLTLPEDADINIFAITVSGNRIDGTRWACEPRALPVIE